MEMDRDGWIAGSRSLEAGLSEKDVEKSRACMRLAAIYFAKGAHSRHRPPVSIGLRTPWLENVPRVGLNSSNSVSTK